MQCFILFRKSHFVLICKRNDWCLYEICKRNDWFLYEIQHCAEMADEDLSRTNIENSAFLINRLSASPTKWSKTICRLLCLIWYHLNNFGNMKNTRGGVLLLVKLQAEACDFTKRTPLHGFFFFRHFKFYKWYQILQSISHLVRPDYS